MDFPLYECPCCGHVQAEYLLADSFYEAYGIEGGISQYYGMHQKTAAQFEQLKSMNHDGETIVEIGCGGGTAISYALKQYHYYYGIEPSSTACLLSRKILRSIQGKGEIIEGYFDKSLRFDRKIDAFCAFQVFEHMLNLHDAMEHLNQTLDENGVGIINVPNGEQIFGDSLFHQIVCEHINYFTPLSLRTLCFRNGFDVEYLDIDREAIELTAYVRKRRKNKGIEEAKYSIRTQLSGLLADADTIGLYGAGAKTIHYHDLINCSKVKFLFDSDIKKAGKYIAGFEEPISLYEPQKAKKCSTIVVLASSYNTEIIKRLKKDGYSGMILYFEGNRVCVTTFEGA